MIPPSMTARPGDVVAWLHEDTVRFGLVTGRHRTGDLYVSPITPPLGLAQAGRKYRLACETVRILLVARSFEDLLIGILNDLVPEDQPT